MVLFLCITSIDYSDIPWALRRHILPVTRLFLLQRSNQSNNKYIIKPMNYCPYVRETTVGIDHTFFPRRDSSSESALMPWARIPQPHNEWVRIVTDVN